MDVITYPCCHPRLELISKSRVCIMDFRKRTGFAKNVSVATILSVIDFWHYITHVILFATQLQRCFPWTWLCMLTSHICVGKLAIIGSGNGLSPGRRQAIIWINAGILLIGPLGTNISEISIEILTFSFKKMRLKVSSAKRRPFCLGLNVLTFGAILVTLFLSHYSS